MSDNTATQKPKLEDRIRAACRVRHYSLATERSYVRWYKQFVRWAGMKHPATLGGDRVESWLSHLATERDVAASTQRQALALMVWVASVRLPRSTRQRPATNCTRQMMRVGLLMADSLLFNVKCHSALVHIALGRCPAQHHRPRLTHHPATHPAIHLGARKLRVCGRDAVLRLDAGRGLSLIHI
jgi:hypothetical protein